MITTLSPWIRISNKLLFYGQEIDPEHWVHLNVKNMYMQTNNEEIKYIVIKQVSYLVYCTSFCLNLIHLCS